MSERASTMAASGAWNEGRVELRARWHDGRVAAVAVRSRRPAATRLLAGRPAAEVATLLPRLFSLCGRAQADAAAAALAAALGRPAPLTGAARQREIVGEHLWRFLLDWPALLGQTPEQRRFAAFFRRLRGGEPAAALRAELRDWHGAGAVDERLAALAEWDVRCMPAKPVLLREHCDALFPEALRQRDEVFAQAPRHHGRAVEVGALTDRDADPRVADLLARGRPLSARFLARWLALGDAIDALPVPAAAPQARRLGSSVGCAWVATARGPLAHRVELQGETVVDYSIVAPTEWNFHRDSAWLKHLEGATAETPAIAENLLRRWVLALDPCVPAKIEIEEI